MGLVNAEIWQVINDIESRKAQLGDRKAGAVIDESIACLHKAREALNRLQPQAWRLVQGYVEKPPAQPDPSPEELGAFKRASLVGHLAEMCLQFRSNNNRPLTLAEFTVDAEERTVGDIVKRHKSAFISLRAPDKSRRRRFCLHEMARAVLGTIGPRPQDSQEADKQQNRSSTARRSRRAK